jgi:signal transduction histidine kinase
LPSAQPPQRIPPPSNPESPPREGGIGTTHALFPTPGHLPRDAFALQAELNRLEQHFAQLRLQLRQTQKLASIGTTAAMLAHEFNNLFTPVVAYATHALQENDTELMRRTLEKMLQRIEAMGTMSDRLVGLAKQPDGVIKAVRLQELVENAISCLGRDLGKDNIDLRIQIDPDLKARANDNQLLQVLFNLIINARQAMLGRRGRLTIDAHAADDDRVVLNVRDSGCGIPPENLERVFEPFFSTKQHADKPDRRGLGLGLAICRDIIEELGGAITVQSEVNVGTTFSITLSGAD